MIKIAIIGAGYWGPNLIRNFSNIHNVKVKYVVDKLPGRRKFVESNFPEIKVVEDIDVIMNDKSVSVVIMATPVSSHFKLAHKALSKRKHVFIEKPFTNSVKDAEKLIALADEKSLKIGVGHIFTFHPGIEYIRKFMVKEKIEPYYLISNRANLRPPKTKHNVIWDLAVHDFSIINYLYQDFPVSIYTSACDCSGKGIYDMAVIILTYPKHKKAVVHVNWHTPNKIRKFELFSCKWSIFFDDMIGQKVQMFDEGIDNRVTADKGSARKFEYRPGVVLNPKIQNIQPLFNECESFIDSIRHDKPYKNDGPQGLWAVKMCKLAEESAKKGQEIQID
jgi:predicted dehydrogenase